MYTFPFHHLIKIPGPALVMVSMCNVLILDYMFLYAVVFYFSLSLLEICCSRNSTTKALKVNLPLND